MLRLTFLLRRFSAQPVKLSSFTATANVFLTSIYVTFPPLIFFSVAQLIFWRPSFPS